MPKPTIKFDDWITSLDEDVIQGEYGYEPGEFSVYPSEWRPMWRKGLTPKQAFDRALAAFAEARLEREEESRRNYERIKIEDAAAIAAQRNP